jgi:hypothetical protein
MTIRSDDSLGCSGPLGRYGPFAGGKLAILLLLVTVVVTGCQHDRELTRMQAEVNRAATDLVIQDAEARRQWMVIQKQLDGDRRQLANERRRDPIIAQAILQIGGMGLCLLPLWLIARLLQRVESDPVLPPLGDRLLDDRLFDELIGHHAALLPGHDRDPPPGSSSVCPPGSGPARGPSDLGALIDDRLRQCRG